MFHTRHLHVFALIAAMALGLATPALAQQDEEAPAIEIDVEAALKERVHGDPDAPITMHEYASLTCSHCARFNTAVLPEFEEEFIKTGRVKIVFHDFPLDGVAVRAHQLARCAPDNQYFPLLDMMFKAQSSWIASDDPLAALVGLAGLAGITPEMANACFAEEALVDGILQARLEASEKHEIQSTPTFIFNDDEERIVGSQPIDAFRRVIEKLER